MALKAGTIGNYEDSMAKAMADAFLQAWPTVMGNDPKPEMNNQMRLMFVAIAQGMVNHLYANRTSFKVTVSNGTITLTGVVTNIEIV